jgi:tRNA A-37 threonylcarbamoyl transferase component Bud32
MLAEPIFQFNEELVKPTIMASGSNHCSNSNSCSNSKPSVVAVAVAAETTCGRVSLKRPSKLELKINLNEQQSALSSPITSLSSPPLQTTTTTTFSHSHSSACHDKNNNSSLLNNQNSQNASSNPMCGGGCGAANGINSKSSLILKDTSNNATNSKQEVITTTTMTTTTTTVVAVGQSTNVKASTTKKKKRRFAADMQSNRFSDVYSLTGEVLGQGAYGKVWTCKNIYTCQEYAVKIIDKYRHPNRERVFKEIEIYLHCRDCVNILKIIEFFEEEEKFYVVFEKMEGGPLLNHIERRGHLTEREASLIVKDIATALNFLHSKGMAHRDLKPENILCQYSDSVIPVKICDFDLGSSIKINSRSATPVTTPELCTPVSLDYTFKKKMRKIKRLRETFFKKDAVAFFVPFKTTH